MTARHKTKIALLASTFMIMFVPLAQAASVPTGLNDARQGETEAVVRVSATSAATSTVSVAAPYRQFAPKAQTSSSTIDYEVWDAALNNIVLRLGQSIRMRAKRPDALVGTRIVKGHKTAYRLEGSRVMFSYLNDEYRDQLTAYRKDLERVANEVDITTLARKEQLVFWLNLHNVTLIEQIALNYPVRQPEKLRVGADKQLLNEAKILNIRGVGLSLRDIRENIVYPNWSNPDVIYGFFRGNIGGPALQNYAFTSNNVDAILKLQAVEFVNSLRGVHESRRALKVSTLYEEVRPFYFADWPNGLKNHLRKHADPKVLDELATNKPLEFDRYDQVVADLLAGDRPSTANLNVRVNGFAQKTRISPEVGRLLRELDDKTKIMRQRGLLNKKGTVTIDDIPTIDVDIPEVADEQK